MKGYKVLERFRGFLPVIVDVETGGFNCEIRNFLKKSPTIFWNNMNEEYKKISPDLVGVCGLIGRTGGWL